MHAEEIQSALVVGAGLMGHGIAQVFAQAGISVHLIDINDRLLDGALKKIAANLDLMAESGRIEHADIAEILARIEPSTDLAMAAPKVDFAIEAVVEKADVKRDIFSRLDTLCPPHAIIASNTSSLDIYSIAQVNRPERLVVCHWFAPAYIIPLVEVVPGPETDDLVAHTAANFMERVGKRPLLMKKFVPSFIVNRIQIQIARAVWEMLENGWATPEEIDLAVKMTLGIRLPTVGVVQTADFTGLDVVYDIFKAQGPVNPLVEEKVRQGHLGIKTSKGFFDYGGRTEAEIIRKRDELFFKTLDHFEKTKAFEPF